jgi:hypothetical protein
LGQINPDEIFQASGSFTIKGIIDKVLPSFHVFSNRLAVGVAQKKDSPGSRFLPGGDQQKDAAAWNALFHLNWPRKFAATGWRGFLPTPDDKYCFPFFWCSLT